MTTVSMRAPAKVNLTLEVLGRRADGYHELLSLVAFASDVADVVTLVEGGPEGVAVTGAFASSMADDRQENTAAKALRLSQTAWPALRPHGVSIEKNIPLSAGLGGGSADAAAALKLLLRASPGEFSRTVDLHDIARGIGADVPVCLGGGQNEPSGEPAAAFMWGVGERIWRPNSGEPPLIPGELYAVLVNPRLPLSTKAVFERLAAKPLAQNAPQPEFPRGFASQAELLDYLKASRNDLEAPAIALVPEIATVLESLVAQAGCEFARMSGSGATCFGVFTSLYTAHSAAEHLRSERPAWWIAPTRLV